VKIYTQYSVNATQLEMPLAVGVGSCGAEMIQALVGKGWPSERLAVWHTERETVERSPAACRLVLGEETLHGLRAATPEVAEAAAEDSLDQIRVQFEGERTVLFLASLGEPTGAGAILPAVETACEKGLYALAVTVLPFAFEGEPLMLWAEEALGRLRRLISGVFVFRSDALVRLEGWDARLSQLLACRRALIAQGARGLARMLFPMGGLTLGLRETIDILSREGAELGFAAAAAEGPKKLPQILEELLRNPVMEDGAVLQRAGMLAVSLVSGTDYLLRELNDLSGLLTRRFPNCRKLMGVGMFPALGETRELTILYSVPRSGAPAGGGQSQAAKRQTTSCRPRVEKESVPRSPDRNLQKPAGSSLPSLPAWRGKFFRPKPEDPQMKLKLEESPTDLIKAWFGKVEPTIYQGEKLDLPTFLRRGSEAN